MLYFQNKLGSSLKSRVFLQKNSFPLARLKGIRTIHTYIHKHIPDFALSTPYSPLPERPRLSLRTINLIQSGMLVRKCIRGGKSDIVLSNYNYGRRQIKAK